MICITFCIGLLLLVTGGELLVHSGVALANKLRLSPLVIGIVLMGCGTSLPELSASLSAMFTNPPTPGIAFGNVIGSNISNILFILGLSALISPIRIPKETFRRDGSFLIISVLMLGVIMAYGYLDSIIGLFLLFSILGYFFICYDKKSNADIQQPKVKSKKPVWLLGTLSVLGIVSIVYGARFLVSAATDIATLFGVSKAVLGLTLVAFGTSLPEVTVSTVAAIHKHSDVAYGNIIGSNISNIFLIVGAIGMARTTEVPQMWQSFWIMAAVTFILLICGIKGRIPRWMGALFLIAYGGYVYVLF